MNTLRNLSICVLSCLALFGCQTFDDETRPDITMPQMQQNTYLSHAKPPQQFGFDVIPVKDGISYSGNCRLHTDHLASARLQQQNLTLIKMDGPSKHDTMTVLIDISSPSSWLEFSTAQDFNAQFMGVDGEVIPYRGGYNTGGENAYAGVVTQLQINQLLMENVPFYIRMVSGSLGPLARGIRTPKVDAILGNDNLRNFEFVQFDLSNNMIRFSATTPYVPHDDLMIAMAEITDLPGYGLAVKGHVDGKPTPVILDFAGNFVFARGDVKTKITRELDLDLLSFDQLPTLLLPIHNSPPRVGRKLLAPYLVTVCNRDGMVYFERPAL
jgi:hypothetical protein